jgi:hypothetical protein
VPPPKKKKKKLKNLSDTIVKNENEKHLDDTISVII